MIHDNAHCSDFTYDCPDECYRAQLVRDLKNLKGQKIIISWAHLKGTSDCLRDKVENGSRKWGEEYGVSDVLCDLDDMQSADVVEVVRCKDCKHYNEYENGEKIIDEEVHDGWCMRWSGIENVNRHDYCSYGERAEA